MKQNRESNWVRIGINFFLKKLELIKEKEKMAGRLRFERERQREVATKNAVEKRNGHISYL